MQLSPYLRLMRLHQPVGIWLLLWPCLWAAALAAGGLPDGRLAGLFALGAVLMRGAGCIINDIADRSFDAQVERTKTRPLASGELRVWQACALLAALLAASLGVAMSLGTLVVLWGALALWPVTIYPLMKRISWWPQLFLGLTFNWGALMGWVAVRGELAWPAVWLYIGGVCWTLGYDTIYAHQDKADDARIGVRSSALRLGVRTKPFVALMYGLALLCWAMAGSGLYFFALLCVAGLHFGWQLYRLEADVPACARRIFFSNAWLGGIIFFACAVSG